MTPHQPPGREHQAKGAAEEAGNTIRDNARVLHIDLQANIRKHIEPDEPTMPWLIRWAAMVISRYVLGKDKNTPYEKQLGRAFHVEIVRFGETVLYRMPEVARYRHQARDEIWGRACGWVMPEVPTPPQ